MGLYDQPGIIEYVRTKTTVDKITYIGHSQGTTQIFAGRCLKMTSTIQFSMDLLH